MDDGGYHYSNDGNHNNYVHDEEDLMIKILSTALMNMIIITITLLHRGQLDPSVGFLTNRLEI